MIELSSRRSAPKRLGIVVSVTAIVVVTFSLIFANREKAGPLSARGVAAAGLGADAAAIARSPHMVFRHTGVDGNYSRLTIASLAPAENGNRASAGFLCDRVSFSSGQGICLQAERGLFTTYRAILFDRTLTRGRSFKLDGSPSRTRVSPDGRVGSITVFLGQAHDYSSSASSTKTTLVDMASGEVMTDLEQFTTWRNGERFQSADFNFWGVTFAHDSNRFYASLRSKGTTYLVRGDLGLRTLTVLRENVECPSLSPDNRRIAFKKRIGPNPAAWRLYVLDVGTMAEHPVASETRAIDDQAEWLDNAHVLYAVPRPGTATTDTWMAPVDSGEPAKVFLAEAESAIVVR
jgi:hypothetical protein